jgi:hypothetical protein
MGKVLGTKVRDEYAEIIEDLAVQNESTPSDILANFVQTIIRISAKAVRCTPYMRHLIAKFEVSFGSKAPANLGILEQNKLEIQDAIYRVTQKGREGCKMLMLDRAMFNSREHACINSAKILERVMKTECPTIYKTLQTVESETEDNSIIDKLITLLNQHAEDALEAEIEQMFLDADRAENGRAVSQQRRYKRKYHKDVDSEYEQRQRIQQADLFGQMADAGMEEEEGG